MVFTVLFSVIFSQLNLPLEIKVLFIFEKDEMFPWYHLKTKV